MPFIIATKYLEYLRINLTKDIILAHWKQLSEYAQRPTQFTENISPGQILSFNIPIVLSFNMPIASQNWVKRRSNYHEFIWKNFWAFPDPKSNACMSLFHSSGWKCPIMYSSTLIVRLFWALLYHILLMDAQNQLRWNIDTCRYNSGLQGLVLRCWVCFPKKELAGPLSLFQCRCCCLWNGCCQTKAECCLPFSPFLHKGQILFGKIGAYVGLTLPHTHLLSPA